MHSFLGDPFLLGEIGNLGQDGLPPLRIQRKGLNQIVHLLVHLSADYRFAIGGADSSFRGAVQCHMDCGRLKYLPPGQYPFYQRSVNRYYWNAAAEEKRSRGIRS